MPRQPRLQVANYPYHVIQRGNDRQAIIHRNADAAALLRVLGECAARADVDIHAYVVMTNHIHLLATPRQDEGLSRMMQCYGRRYVRYFNDAHRRTGTLWEGRYKSSLVETERYLLACYRYIELNPVRAGMVDRPWDYRWSSCRANVLGRPDDLVSPHAELIELARNPELRARIYREMLLDAIDDETLARLRWSVQHDQPLAVDKYVTSLERRLERRVRLGKSGRPKKTAEESGRGQKTGSE